MAQILNKLNTKLEDVIPLESLMVSNDNDNEWIH
jgi:hypothetical protein